MTRPGDLRVGVTALVQRPGTRLEVHRSLRPGPLEVAGTVVPAHADVELDVVVESTADPGTLTVMGTVTAPWTGACRRCLEPVRGRLEVEVREVYSKRPSVDDDDVWPLEGEEIDLGALVREAVLLGLPLAPLCSDTCPGPAPDTFPARPADAPPSGPDAPAARDERWAALDELRFD